MLKKILSLVLNCEKKGDRKTDQTTGKNPTGRSEEFVSSVGVTGTQKQTEKYPDPWFN